MLLALRRETFLLSGLSLNFGKIQTQAFPLEKKMRQGSGVWEGRVSETNLIPKSRVPGEAKRARQGPVGREPCADIISSLFLPPW